MAVEDTSLGEEKKMKKISLFVILIAFIFLIVSCSVRYMKFSKAAKRFVNGSISRETYDSLLNTFYVNNKTNFTAHSRIKLAGSYVCADYDDYYNKIDYRTLKFTDSSFVFKSSRFYEPLNNNTLARTEGTNRRYTTKGDELVLEYLLNRDYELYNIFKYAKISRTGDTLTFYRTVNLQRPHEKNTIEKEEMYIYNSSLTVLPILPK